MPSPLVRSMVSYIDELLTYICLVRPRERAGDDQKRDPECLNKLFSLNSLFHYKLIDKSWYRR